MKGIYGGQISGRGKIPAQLFFDEPEKYLDKATSGVAEKIN